MSLPRATSSYINRIVEHELDELAGALPAISIEGAKGVGKTATALARTDAQFLLDDSRQLALVGADPNLLVANEQPTLIDEWQRFEQSWDLVRRAVDGGAAPGSFVLTGSAAPLRPSTHSGAGRIVSVRMRPLSLAERLADSPTVSLAELISGRKARPEGQTTVTLENYVDEILRSGFPGLRGFEGRALRAHLDSYLQRIFDRELPELGYRTRNPAGLMRWLRAYAAAISTTTSLAKIRNAAEGANGELLNKATTVAMRDALAHIWVLDPVPGWTPSGSQIARVAAPAKHQLVDPALAANLLGQSAETLLSFEADPERIEHHPADWFGSLFESLVTLSVRVYAQHSEAVVSHLRTYRGEREIDLIVERKDGRVLPIEVKSTAVPNDRDVRHLHWLKEQLGDQVLDKVIVTTGPFAYRREDGVAVVPAALLGP